MKKTAPSKGSSSENKRTQEEEYELFQLNRLVTEGEKILRAFPNILDPEEIYKHYLSNYHFYKQDEESPKDLEKFNKYNIEKQLEKAIGYSEIKLPQLKLNQIHYGFVIELEILHQSYKDFPYNIIAKNNQSITRASIFNCEDEYDFSFYQKGQKLLILNPFFRLAHEYTPYIKVSKHSEIIFVKKGFQFSEWQKQFVASKTQTELKEQANKFYSNKEYQKAINIYQLTLTKQIDDDKFKSILHGNSSQAYINLQNYEKGLYEAEEALKLDSGNEKYILRKANCLIYLNREEEVVELIEKISIKVDKEALLEQLKLVYYQKKGLYNIHNIIKGSQILEYISDIEIFKTEKKGRGVKATRSYKKGELIFVEKAFSLINHLEKLDFLNDENELYNQIPENLQMIRQTQISMFNNKEKVPKLLYLYNGSNSESLITIEDIKKPEKEIKKNQLNYQALTKIVKYNQQECFNFDLNIDMIKTNKKIWGQNKEAEKNQGIWILYSFINHSCQPNTFKLMIREYIFVFAYQDINIGAELTTNYLDIITPYEIKKSIYADRFNFCCDCRVCKNYEKLPYETKEILKEIGNHYARRNQKYQEKNKETLGQFGQKQSNVDPKKTVDYLEEIFPQLTEMLASQTILIPEYLWAEYELFDWACACEKKDLILQIWNDLKDQDLFIQEFLQLRIIIKDSTFGVKNVRKEYEKILQELSQQFFNDHHLELLKKYIMGEKDQ